MQIKIETRLFTGTLGDKWLETPADTGVCDTTSMAIEEAIHPIMHARHAPGFHFICAALASADDLNDWQNLVA
jgi:hypothetical protein